MKCTNSASVYQRKLSPELIECISDSVWLVKATEPPPPGVDPSKCIAIGERLDPKEIISIAHSTGIGHVIQGVESNLEQEIYASAMMISEVGRFMAAPTRYIFGLEKASVHGGGNERDCLKLSFRAPEDKQLIRDQIHSYVDNLYKTSSIKDSILAVFDEMFINALYNAPGRDGDVGVHGEYKGRQKAEIFLEHVDEQLVIGCSDPFGSLKVKNVLKCMWSSYLGRTVRSINMGPGGAGLGCRMIFNNCTDFYAAVQPGVKTLFCAKIIIGKSAKHNARALKNLHLNG